MGAMALGSAAGVAAGGALLVGAFWLRQANLDFDLQDAQRASSILQPWPEPLEQVARIHVYRSRTGHPRSTELRAAERALDLALRRDPADAAILVELSYLRLALGQTSGARSALQAALALDPWSLAALSALADLEIAEGNTPAARSSISKIRAVAPNHPVVAELEESLRERERASRTK